MRRGWGSPGSCSCGRNLADGRRAAEQHRVCRERAGAQPSPEFTCTPWVCDAQPIHAPQSQVDHWWDMIMDPWEEAAAAPGALPWLSCSQAISRDVLKDNTRDHPLVQVLLTVLLIFTAINEPILHFISIVLYRN